MPRVPPEDVEEFLRRTPALEGVVLRPTSPATRRYNCLAWALGDTSKAWAPHGSPRRRECDGTRTYWPEGAPSLDELGSYAAVLKRQGFRPCEDEESRPGWTKIVLYVERSRGVDLVHHAARQLPSGKWTSKVGELIDVEHDAPGALWLLYARPEADTRLLFYEAHTLAPNG